MRGGENAIIFRHTRDSAYFSTLMTFRLITTNGLCNMQHPCDLRCVQECTAELGGGARNQETYPNRGSNS